MKNKSLVILIVLILSKNLLATTEPFTSTSSQVDGSNMDKNQNQPMLELYIGDLRSAGIIDGFGKTARFAYPEGITVDKNGNVFVSDSIERKNEGIANNLIRNISPQGEVSTFAGATGTNGSDNGAGKSTTFHKPSGLVVDAAGNVYVADHYNNCIRKITPDKVVSTFSGVCGDRGNEDGPQGKARFFSPKAVAIDKKGFLYVGDETNRNLRKISPDGVVTTVAGSDKSFGESVDGRGDKASFIGLSGLSFDSHGVLYVADSRAIRKVTAEGEVSTLLLKFKEDKKIDFEWFKGLTIDPQDNIYVIDRNAIYKVLKTGEVNLFAGDPRQSSNEDGAGSVARFYGPEGLASDFSGNIYVADSNNMSVRTITPEGVVSTLAGPAIQNMKFNTTEKTQIVLDSKGNIYATGRNPIANTINKITPQGVGSVIPLNMSSSIRALAVDSKDNVYLNEQKDTYSEAGRGGSEYSPVPKFLRFQEKGYSKIHKLSPSGNLTTVVGKTSEVFFDIAVDTAANIYIASTNQLKKITPRAFLPNKTQVLVDYDFNPFENVDRSKASVMEFKEAFPSQLITDKENNLYFIEHSYISVRKVESDGAVSVGGKRGEGQGSHFEIKKITPSGKITVIAGSDKNLGAVDGVGAAASFDFPKNLCIDSKNNLYILESKLQTIRKIDPNGKVSTIIGKAGENKFIEGPLPAGITNTLSMTVHGNSLYIVMQNGMAVVRDLP